ncbi:MAG: hypothetical protein GY862_01875 [Gammaproteobacteria bacterium]|nr:hypothetical protein [Gammaproteobacteria bacterium]
MTNDKKHITELLLECPALKSAQDRTAVLSLLPPAISDAIKTSESKKIHVLNIVNTCLEHPDGLKFLVEAVQFFDAETKAFQRLNTFLENGKTEDGKAKIFLEKLPHPAAPLQGRIDELALLDQAFADPEIILAALIAPGGVGKSALTDEWLARSAKNHYNGAGRVFAWSFYSQGAHTTATTSAPFFDAALPFFGHTGALPKDEAEKGRALIHCLEKQNFLLILDGLEPLQHPVHSLDGELSDTALKSFFIHLRRMSGEKRLILISSRQPVFELENWRPQNFRQLDLQTLPPADGADLLHNLGAQGPKKELKNVARRLGGHALALVLTGRLVKNRLRGDIRRLDTVPDFFDAPRDGDHARRVMREYERLYPPDSPQRILLALMGLFDRPMEEVERLVLCERADLAKPLAELDPDQLEEVARDLEQAGLLLSTPAPRLIWDCHPLVRAYFGRHGREAQTQAQMVLFKYFQLLPNKQQPDTLEELEPLYRAVVHGCLAGEYQKAREVYRNRILRGDEAYSLHKLGAHTRDINALAGFFPNGWEKPMSAELSEADRAWLLQVAAYCLVSLGRLAEAVRPRRAGLKIEVKREDWKNAAISAENLTDLYLPLGQLDQAQEAAEQAISYADRAGDALWRMSSRAHLATALHGRGDLEDAQARFAEAEVIQAERDPQSPRLYGLAEARYCALLLEQARDSATRREVLERGQYSLKIVKNLLSIAFSHLTLGRTLAVLHGLEQARPELDAAVRGMRRAGMVYFMPEFLLTRARLLAETDLEQTRRDLEEADGIIQRCGMKLYAVDSALLHARLALDSGDRDAARAFRETAEKLIQATGYRLRTPELRSLSADLAD